MFDALKVKNECVAWIRDFFAKNGPDCNAVIGISGGKDSSIAAALCVGLQENMELGKLACFCNCTGSLVCTKRGAVGMALPTRAEVEELMASGVCRLELTALDNLE